MPTLPKKRKFEKDSWTGRGDGHPAHPPPHTAHLHAVAIDKGHLVDHRLPPPPLSGQQRAPVSTPAQPAGEGGTTALSVAAGMFRSAGGGDSTPAFTALSSVSETKDGSAHETPTASGVPPERNAHVDAKPRRAYSPRPHRRGQTRRRDLGRGGRARSRRPAQRRGRRPRLAGRCTPPRPPRR